MPRYGHVGRPLAMAWARAGCSLGWLHLRQSTSAPTAMTWSRQPKRFQNVSRSCQIIGIHTCYESAYCFGMATPYSSIQRAVASFAGGCRCLHMRLRTIFHQMFRSGLQWFDTVLWSYLRLHFLIVFWSLQGIPLTLFRQDWRLMEV